MFVEAVGPRRRPYVVADAYGSDARVYVVEVERRHLDGVADLHVNEMTQRGSKEGLLVGCVGVFEGSLDNAELLLGRLVHDPSAPQRVAVEEPPVGKRLERHGVVALVAQVVCRRVECGLGGVDLGLSRSAV